MSSDRDTASGDLRELEHQTPMDLRALARETGVREADILGTEDLIRRLAIAWELQGFSLQELQELAKEKGVEGHEAMDREELVSALGEVLKPGWRARGLVGDESGSRRGLWGTSREVGLRRWIGTVLRIVSAAGVILSLAGLVALPFLSLRLSADVERGLLASSLQARLLSESAGKAGDSLAQGGEAVLAAVGVLRSMEPMIGQTNELLDSVAELVGTQAPESIEASREGLLAARESAQAIDRVLEALSAIRFLTGVTYDPEQPLADSLADVAATLDPLPADFRKVSEDLVGVTQDLDEAKGSLSNASASLELVAESLGDVEEDVQRWSADLAGLADMLEDGAPRARSMAWLVMAFMGLLLLWIAVSQYVAYVVARDLLR